MPSELAAAGPLFPAKSVQSTCAALLGQRCCTRQKKKNGDFKHSSAYYCTEDNFTCGDSSSILSYSIAAWRWTQRHLSLIQRRGLKSNILCTKWPQRKYHSTPLEKKVMWSRPSDNPLYWLLFFLLSGRSTRSMEIESHCRVAGAAVPLSGWRRPGAKQRQAFLGS